MSSHSTGNRSSDFRHRIREITLRPDTSKRPVSLEIQVNDKAVHKLPTIEPGQLLHWDTQTYPCDTHAGARVKLKFTEKHRLSSDQDVFVEYIVSNDPN
ncbi:hypothetical protein BDV93DRAFT_566494 [Ceratobasidium sp. AG-I]|nr:hypothetical protein BDV93DRAFT_566494 [Ceratobasidium sp. AG-I]